MGRAALVAGAIGLAVLGLLPQTLGALTSGQLDVLRLTILDPALVVTVCLIIALWNPGRVERALDYGLVAFQAICPRVLLALLAGSALALAAFFSWYCFARQPVLTDEFSQLFQASLLLDGHLTARPEQLAEFFETAQTVRAGERWFSEFPIGGAVLLAAARMLRAEWLLNPALAAISVALVFGVVRASHGDATARIAALLFAFSPFVLFMSASRMNHPMALAAQLGALYGLVRWQAASGNAARWWAALIGGGFGAMATTRPFDAALIALPIGLFQLAEVRQVRSKAATLIVQCAVASLFVGGLLMANAATTGDPLVFGYDLLNGPDHRPGFHMNPMGRQFTAAAGISLVSLYLTRLNVALFESAVPALVFVCATLLLIRRPTRWDYLHLGIIAATIAGYAAYWFNGDFVGPRFLYPAIPSFILFTARLGAEAAATFHRSPVSRVGIRLAVPICLLIAWNPVSPASLPTGVRLRAYAHRNTPEAGSPAVETEVRQAGLTNALVFVREPLHGRLAARLRALGMRPYAAERAASDLDACAFVDALSDVDTVRVLPSGQAIETLLARARVAGPAVPVPGLSGARSLSLADGRPATHRCAAEIARDSAGTYAFDAFLARASFDNARRLSGPVVFARDLGSRNELLRQRFSDRVWLRYRPGGGSGPAFVPY